MYKLYYSPGACSLAVHIALMETKQPFTLENVKAADADKAAFLAANPRGSVPVLEDDGFVVREGAAILLHLLDTHKSPLLPREGRERASALEWLMFCNATLHPAYSRAFGAQRQFGAELAPKVIEVAVKMINAHWRDVESRLETSAYLAGDSLTISDILLTVIANWSGAFQGIEIGPRTRALLAKVSTLPSYQKAMEAEGVSYKAA